MNIHHMLQTVVQGNMYQIKVRQMAYVWQKKIKGISLDENVRISVKT